MAAASASLAFRILYNTLYYALYLILLGVLIVSPADLMRQALTHHNNTNILIIAASYLVTILVLAFIYAARLYVNRSVLASIPKSWIPVEKGDGVPRKVREVIARDLSRSAAIAWGARPRVEEVRELTGTGGGSRLGTGVVGTGAVGLVGRGSRGTSHSDGTRGEGVAAGWAKIRKEKTGKGLAVVVEQPEKRTHKMISKLRRTSRTGGGGEEKDIATAAAVASVGIVPPPEETGRPAVWGEIEHPGWASPTSLDLPNLQYNAVILELPNLIEAKALTLAPRDPESRSEPPTLDPDAVAILQRPETMGLREYLVHLTEIEVLTPVVVGPFISQYERARFSTRPVTNRQFRELMHVFAEVLRGMQPLDPAVLLEEYDDDDDDYESAIYDTDIDNDAPRGTSSSSGGEESSTHGHINTTNNVDDDDDAKGSRRSRRNIKLGDNHTETYNNADENHSLNNTKNFNDTINDHNLSMRPASSSSSSKSNTSGASLSSQRRYPTRKSLGPTTTGTGTGGRNTPSILMRNSSANTWQNSQSQQFRTAPTTPKSRRTVLTTRSSRRRSSSSTSTSRTNRSYGSSHSGIPENSFAQTRRPYIIASSSEGEGTGSGDGSSMQSGRSGGSDGGSVVIRLASGEEESVNGLPYILERTISTQ